MEELLKGIYKIPVPLPNSPLKELNAYIVRGKDRNLLIDTGYNTEIGEKALLQAYETMGLIKAETDIFLTHLHSDHTGLVSCVKSDENRVFIGETDGERLKKFLSEDYWIAFMEYQNFMGVDSDKKLKHGDHPAYQNRLDKVPEMTYVQVGQRLSYGGYHFQVIDLAGHTPGHMGLWDETASVLFCGDHILEKISPNINLWDFKADYLGLYLKNLEKVMVLDPKHTFTAHRKLPESGKKRAAQLIEHHQHRLDEIVKLVEQGAQTPVEVAKGMKWDFAGGIFANFPTPQKWFATSEAFAHLEHLYALNRLKRDNTQVAYRYFI